MSRHYRHARTRRAIASVEWRGRTCRVYYVGGQVAIVATRLVEAF